MSRENALWKVVADNLSPFGMLRRVENAIDSGEGDVAYVLRRPKDGSAPSSGWLELKAIDRFPARPSTPLRVDHLTVEQVLFAEAWARAGGKAFMLLRAAPWHLLFDPAGIRGVFEREVTAADAPAVAVAAGTRPFPTGRILRCLAP